MRASTITIISLATVGCGDTTALDAGTDAAARDASTGDLAMPLDQASADEAADAASPPDQAARDSSSNDLAMPPDLAMPVDLAHGPTQMDYSGCAQYLDFTGGQGPTIKFGGIVGDNYSPQCSKVSVNQTVTWSGDFGSHPLTMASSNLVAVQPNIGGMTATAMFATPGFYGFYCAVHGADDGSGMAGALQVVP